MIDPIFSDPRLAAIYDAFDGERHDLAPYLAMAMDFGATSILDIGSGTGNFACLAAAHGFNVTGVEPAEASIKVARLKPHGGEVRWILGDATTLPPLAVDMAVMTGNVAQVFLTDDEWHRTLLAVRFKLAVGGRFVFEVRDPSQKAWERWTRERTFSRRDVPGIGIVEGWCDLLGVSGELVRFKWTYRFASDGLILSSESTLRFRPKDDLIDTLDRAGFTVSEIRDAPDRPSQEFVFIAAPA